MGCEMMKKKIFIYPVNSLILSDIVEHFGHEPLTMMGQIRELENEKCQSTDSDRHNFEPKMGLKYLPVEVPSGVRGRLSIIGPLVEKADASIIMEDADFGFGCGGCARTNEVVPHIIMLQKIPYIRVKMPTDIDSATEMVKKIKEFLSSLEG
jgi:putative methanogenesis marker protein 5